MKLNEKYENYLLDNNWKDRSGGIDWESFSFINKLSDKSYYFTITVVDRGDKVLLRKQRGSYTEEYVTSENPEVVIPNLLMWQSV